jgi:hypothetical protein
MGRRAGKPNSFEVWYVENKFKKPLERLLVELYWLQGKNYEECARALDVAPGTLGGWMWRLGLNMHSVARDLASEYGIELEDRVESFLQTGRHAS